MKATSKPKSKSTSKPESKSKTKSASKASPSSTPAAATTTFIVPPSLTTQVQEKGIMEEAARLLFDDKLSDTKFLRYLKSRSISTTKAALPAFRCDHGFLWAAGRALRLQSELQARYGLTPAQAMRLIMSQRLLEGTSDSRTDQRDLLQTATLILREDQVQLGLDRLQHELQFKTRALDQRDEALLLQTRRIETLEAKVHEATSLTENAEMSQDDRISQIRAIFGR